jgi:LuxR family maltose regulon positive regulatory protein
LAGSIKILVLQSIACQAAGDPASSRAAMQRALQLAEPQGFLRTFTDEGQAVLEILHGFIGETQLVGQEYLHQLLDSFNESAGR